MQQDELLRKADEIAERSLSERLHEAERERDRLRDECAQLAMQNATLQAQVAAHREALNEGEVKVLTEAVLSIKEIALGEGWSVDNGADFEIDTDAAITKLTEIAVALIGRTKP